MLTLALTCVWVEIRQGTPGGQLPDSVVARVYSMDQNRSTLGIDTVVIPTSGTQIRAQGPLVGVEVIYQGVSFFSDPVGPDDTARIMLYEKGGKLEDVKIKSYSAMFVSYGDTALVSEMLELENFGDRVVSGQVLVALPLPKGIIYFQRLGFHEDYWLSSDSDTIFWAPNVVPGSPVPAIITYMYFIPLGFQLERRFSSPPDSVFFLTDDSVRLRAKGLSKVGVQDIGGIPLHSWEFPQPGAEISVWVDKSRSMAPWVRYGVAALGVLLVLIGGWWFIAVKGKRRRIMARLGELELLLEEGKMDDEEYWERRRELLGQLRSQEEPEESGEES